MNIANLLKSDENGYRVKPTGQSVGRQAEKPQSAESMLVDLRSRGGTGSSSINDREVKRLKHKLLWEDMMTNALIVIVISLVSYFFIPAKIVGPIKAAAVTSNSEPSQSW